MNKLLVVGLMTSLVIIFLIGGGVGVIYKSKQDTPQIEIAKKIDSISEKLSSKLVNNISVSGQVVKIENNNITLSNQGDSLTVHIKDGASIFSFATDSKGQSVQKQMSLLQVENGRSLNMIVKVLPNGELEGESVIVLPIIPVIKSGGAGGANGR